MLNEVWWRRVDTKKKKFIAKNILTMALKMWDSVFCVIYNLKWIKAKTKNNLFHDLFTVIP